MNFKKKDIYWMRKAIFFAKKAKKYSEVPVGAVLVYKNGLVSRAWNSSIFYNDPSAHAEVLALRYGGDYFKNYRLLKTTLYVTLEPCLMCFGAILNARIHRLVYGASDYKFKSIQAIIKFFNTYNIKNYRVNITSGVLFKECSEVLISFFKNKRLLKSKF